MWITGEQKPDLFISPAEGLLQVKTIARLRLYPMLFADGLLNFHSLNQYLLSTSSALGPVLAEDEAVYKINKIPLSCHLYLEGKLGSKQEI